MSKLPTPFEVYHIYTGTAAARELPGIGSVNAYRGRVEVKLPVREVRCRDRRLLCRWLHVINAFIDIDVRFMRHRLANILFHSGGEFDTGLHVGRLDERILQKLVCQFIQFLVGGADTVELRHMSFFRACCGHHRRPRFDAFLTDAEQRLDDDILCRHHVRKGADVFAGDGCHPLRRCPKSRIGFGYDDQFPRSDLRLAGNRSTRSTRSGAASLARAFSGCCPRRFLGSHRDISFSELPLRRARGFVVR